MQKSRQLTKEVCVQVLAMSVGQALGRFALLLNSLFSSVRVYRRNNEYASLIDQLEKDKEQLQSYIHRY